MITIHPFKFFFIDVGVEAYPRGITREIEAKVVRLSREAPGPDLSLDPVPCRKGGPRSLAENTH